MSKLTFQSFMSVMLIDEHVIYAKHSVSVGRKMINRRLSWGW